MTSYKFILWPAIVGCHLLATGCDNKPKDLGAESSTKGPESPLASLPKAAAGEKINWLTSYDGAEQESKATGKLIMLDFVTDWCQWCKVMESKTYPDPVIVEMTKKLIPLRMDAEKGGLKLARKYGIGTFPMVLCLDADGSVAGYIEGYVTPEEMAPRIQTILKANEDFYSTKAKVKQDPKDTDSLTKLATMAAMRLDVADAEPALKKVEELNPKGGSLALNGAYNALGAMYGREGKTDLAIQKFKRAVAISTDGRQRSVSMVNLGSALINAGKKKEAIPILEETLKLPGVTDQGRQMIGELLKKAGAEVSFTEEPIKK